MKTLKLRDNCPACGVSIGELHLPMCSVERCPLCGMQMLQDECCYAYFDIAVATMKMTHPGIYSGGLPEHMQDEWDAYITPFLLPWDGVWPGVRECREYGFWSKWTEHGWETCDADDPDATEDVNALAGKTRWDREAKRYVLKEDGK